MHYNSIISGRYIQKLKHQNGAIRQGFPLSGWFTKNNNPFKTYLSLNI